MSKEFKKYMTRYHIGWMILSALLGGLLLTFVGFLIFSEGAKLRGLLVFGGLLLLSLIPLWRSKRFFEQLAEDAMAYRIQEDFEKAESMNKDRVRFGEKWIFPKHKSKIVAYEDLKQVFVFVHIVNWVEKSRSLEYIDEKGKEQTLCALELKQKSSAEVQRMLRKIKSHNPKVKFEYRKSSKIAFGDDDIDTITDPHVEIKPLDMENK